MYGLFLNLGQRFIKQQHVIVAGPSRRLGHRMPRCWAGAQKSNMTKTIFARASSLRTTSKPETMRAFPQKEERPYPGSVSKRAQGLGLKQQTVHLRLKALDLVLFGLHVRRARGLGLDLVKPGLQCLGLGGKLHCVRLASSVLTLAESIFLRRLASSLSRPDTLPTRASRSARLAALSDSS